MSLAWCSNCEMLTNDCSTPCHKCGGPLEYVTVEPTEDFIKASRGYDEAHLDPAYLELHDKYTALRKERDELQEALKPVARWWTDPDFHSADLEDAILENPKIEETLAALSETEGLRLEKEMDEYGPETAGDK